MTEKRRGEGKKSSHERTTFGELHFKSQHNKELYFHHPWIVGGNNFIDVLLPFLYLDLTADDAVLYFTILADKGRVTDVRSLEIARYADY